MMDQVVFQIEIWIFDPFGMGHIEGHHSDLLSVDGQQMNARSEMLIEVFEAKLPFQDINGRDVHGAACGFGVEEGCVGGAKSHNRR